MVFEGVPPTTNHAYIDKVVPAANQPKGGKGKGGGKRWVVKRILSPEGEAYKLGISTQVAQRYGAQTTWVRKDVPYGLLIQVEMVIENSGWPKDAESRYKKLDASNRCKLLEDALAPSLGIDDRQFLTVTVHKVHSLVERTQVWIWTL